MKRRGNGIEREKNLSWKEGDKWVLALVLRFTHARREMSKFQNTHFPQLPSAPTE
jgi:hypothetical protein